MLRTLMIIHEWVGVDIKPRLKHTYFQTWPYQVLSVSSLRPIASIVIAADLKGPKISKMSPSMSNLLTHKQQRGKCQHYQAKCPPRSIALAALSRLGASIRDQWAMINNTPELENESAWFSWGYVSLYLPNVRKIPRCKNHRVNDYYLSIHPDL